MLREDRPCRMKLVRLLQSAVAFWSIALAATAREARGGATPRRFDFAIL